MTDATARTIEGIEHNSVDITFDTAGTDAGTYALAYDGIVDALDSHDATVITIDEAGQQQNLRIVQQLASRGAADAAPRRNPERSVEQ